MNEDLYFKHSASLRIFGEIESHDKITSIVGVQPTYTHRQGQKRTKISEPYEHDMWLYKVSVPVSESLSTHLRELRNKISPNINEILKLKEDLTVNIFCGYRSNCDHAGFSVDHESLKIFSELKIPLDVSVIVT